MLTLVYVNYYRVMWSKTVFNISFCFGKYQLLSTSNDMKIREKSSCNTCRLDSIFVGKNSIRIQLAKGIFTKYEEQFY